MALAYSPRKQVVPLAAGDDRPSLRSSHPTLTRRVYFCGVVVENADNGYELPPDVQDLVASLGDPLYLDESSSSSSNTDLLQAGNDPYVRKRAISDHSPSSATDYSRLSESSRPPPIRKRSNTVSNALIDITNELVATERSYVNRLRSLKTDYAEPLRFFSKNKDTAIIPPYEAKTLFGNIDQLLPINEAFLEDLEKMVAPGGSETVGGMGDVALKHFKDLKGFENYKQYYAKREEAQGIFEREMRKASGFSAFVDRIKYSSPDNRNRVGLRELLMDPVQRIPRYTLMFRTMIKEMSPHDPQRAKLLEADEIASKIALAETDEQTKRAAIMYCLSATVEDFPPALISNSRKFVDCIDVDDVLLPDRTSDPGTSVAGPNAGTLHCSLLLFDDKILILKRPSGEKGVRALTGLDDLDRSHKSKGIPMGMKKAGLLCKGVVDVTEVTASDVGGADFHLFFESPPQGQTERWSGRPFRALSVVHPPFPINLEPRRTETDKTRFLENLWAVQARYRTKAGQSVVLCAEEKEVENRGGRITKAKAYFNLYQRTEFLKEPKKTKIVLHIDPLGTADPIPFGMNGPPYVVVKVQPMAGELARYTVKSGDPNDEGEEDIVQTARVPGRIIQTIHQFGLFNFRTGNNSMPSTPTASTRSRAAIFGLDAISRNLFHSRPGSSKDIFGGSINGHRRSKTSANSRSSMYTQSTSSGESSMSRFTRSRSNSTTATTNSLMDDDISERSGSRSSRRSHSLSKAKKFIKRKIPPSAVSDGSGSEAEGSEERGTSPMSVPIDGSFVRSPSSEMETDFSDYYDEGEPLSSTRNHHVDQSERDLAARLALARKNSQSQHESQYDPLILDRPLEDTIYEIDAAAYRRPLSRASESRELPELPPEARTRPITPRPDSTTPTKPTDAEGRSRPLSRQSGERPLHGPRTPSPLPPSRTRVSALPSMDDDLAHEHTLVNAPQLVTPKRPTRPVSPLPRSKRQPFDVAVHAEVTPKAANSDEGMKPPSSVEPLVIRRKTSMQFNGSPYRRRIYNAPRNSPLTKPTGRVGSLRRTSSQLKHNKLSTPSISSEDLEYVIDLAVDTQESMESAYRSIRRIKVECERSTTASAIGTPPVTDRDRSPSPAKGILTPPRSTPMTREAQARMEEMQKVIGKRMTETVRPRPLSMATESSLSRLLESPRTDIIVRSVDELASQADADLSKAIKNEELIQGHLKALTSLLLEKSNELEKSKLDLQNAKRQCEVVKRLFDDCMAEKEIMYEAFNEELDGMYNDANLPEDESWAAITKDLRQTKEARNTLSKENSLLQRQLADAELQKEELRTLLQANGLIS